MIKLSENILTDLSLPSGAVTNFLVTINAHHSDGIYLSDFHTEIPWWEEGNKVTFYDLNLSISGIQHKIDTRQNSIQISNAKIRVTNFPTILQDHSEQSMTEFSHAKYISFSDYIYANNIMNKECQIYLRTQSAQYLTDCLLVYTGIINSIEHDSKFVNIDIEDKFTPLLKEEFPRGQLDKRNYTLRKEDINRTIPVVYGDVDKSPVILLTDSDNNRSLSIYSVPDNIFSRSEDIELRGQWTENQPVDGFNIINSPLYVFKGDYFNILEHHDNSVIEQAGTADWVWDETQQVINQGQYCEIPRLMQGILPKNPPAVNEFQCVKIRTPIDVMVAADPDGGDIDFTDLSGKLVKYKDAGILSPQNSVIRSVDVNDSMSWNSPLRSTIPNPYWSQENLFYEYGDIDLPGEEDEIETLAWIAHDVRLHGVDGYYGNTTRAARGFYAPRAGAGDNNNHEGQTVHAKTFEWLQLNAHHLNEQSDYTSMDFQAVITIQWKAYYIYKAIYRFIAEHYTELEFRALATSVGDPISSDYQAQPQMIGTYNYGEFFTCDALNTLSPMAYSDYNTTSVPWVAADYDNMFNAPAYMDWHSNLSRFNTLYNTNPVMYPQSWIMAFKITNQAVINHTGYEYVILSQENGSFSDAESWFRASPSAPGAKFYNMYDLENPLNSTVYNNPFQGIVNSNWRWAADGITPTTQSANGNFYTYQDKFAGSQRRITSVERPFNSGGARIHQLAIQHDYMMNETPLADSSSELSQIFPDDDLEYMSGYDTIPQYWYNYTNHTGTLQSDIVGDGTMLYFIMVNISDVGNQIEGAFTDLRPYPTNQFTIGAGTIIPYVNLCPTTVNNGSGEVYTGIPAFKSRIAAYNSTLSMDTGTVEQQYPWDFIPDDVSERVHIEATSGITEAETRLGIAYLFNDQEISDELKADTFLLGRMTVTIDTFTNTDQCYYTVGLGGIDTTSLGAVNFETIDDNITDIFSVRMDEFDQYAGDFDASPALNWSSNSALSAGSINLYDQNLRVGGLIDGGFWQVNNYNGLLLEHKLEPVSGYGTETLSFKKHIWNVGLLHFIILDDVFTSGFYANTRGRVSKEELVYFTSQGDIRNMYSWSDDFQINYFEHQISHIIEVELGYEDSIDRLKDQLRPFIEDSDSGWYVHHLYNEFDFTIDEKTPFKDFINDFCQSTRSKMLYTSVDGKIRFIDLKQISDRTQLNTTSQSWIHAMDIKNNDTIKYKIKRTPTQELVTLVNFKYAFDYAKGEFSKETGYTDAYDHFGNGDSTHRIENNLDGYSYDYVGLKRDSKILTIENKYIRSDAQAIWWRNWVMINGCNQKLTIDLTLPLKYISLEPGDVIKFDELLGGVKAYGEDYTKVNRRNAQQILPNFVVISKRVQKGVLKILVEQLHGNAHAEDFEVTKGSPTRSWSNSDPPETIPESYLLEDALMIDSFLLKDYDYFTDKQEWACDIDSSGQVDLIDSWVAWGTTFQDPEGDDFQDPDLNLDINFSGEFDEYDFSIFMAVLMYWNNNLALIEQDGDPSTGGFDYEQAFIDGDIASGQIEIYRRSDINSDGVVNHIDLLLFIDVAASNYNFNIDALIAYWIDSDSWFYPYYP